MTRDRSGRCSVASLTRAEPQEGTASHVRGYVLLECPGPWGRDALRDSRLPAPVTARLRALDRSGLKALLIRRERPAPGTRLFLARSGRLRTALLDDPEELVDLDLGADHDSRLVDDPQRLYLVCTHGRHDVCCAELGRPLWHAAHEAAPDRTWQSSHLGGDRFAGNLLVLPGGVAYGRVAPEAAAGIIAAHERGEVDLHHLRGRGTLPFAVQAAEIALRRLLDHVDERPPRVVSRGPDGVVLEVDASAGPRRWLVRLDVSSAPATRLTCRAIGASAAPRYDVAGIETVVAGSASGSDEEAG